MNNKRFSVFLIFVLVSSVVLFSSVNVAGASVISSYDWTTFKGNAQRNGYTDSPAPNSNQTYWKFQTGGAIKSSPVVSEGIVFVTSTDGYLYAVNATNGTKLWEFWVGQDVNSPTVAHGKVFVTSESGNMFAVDMHSGLQVWNKSLTEAVGFGSPLVVGTRVLVNGNKTVFAVNEVVGVTLYEESASYLNGLAPLACDDSFYGTGLIVSVTLQGAQVGLHGFEVPEGYGRFWMTLEATPITILKSGAAISNGNTFVVTVNNNQNGELWALNSMGQRTWNLELDGKTEASPAVAYDTVYIPTSNNVYAVDKENGTTKWSRPLDGGYSVSSPAVADGKVYFGLDNNYVYALDAFTGNTAWSYKTGGAVQSSPAISDGLLFVGSDDGYLYAIGTPATQAFDAGKWNDENYSVQVTSNSPVTDFVFNSTQKQMRFNVENQNGATGFCNVTFSKTLLQGPYSVGTETQQLVFSEQTNSSHVFVSFNYTGNSVIQINGTEAIPEFPAWITLLFLILIPTAALLVYKRKLTKK
jgi:outer membrane protein assembly factor BamB